eukprot:Sro986_g228130.2  (115) ;mRNA; r:28606-28950
MAILHDAHDEYTTTTTTTTHNNNKVSQYIQVAIQPEQMYMEYTRGITHWCLSHLPVSNCFIAHYCQTSQSKTEELMPTYYQYIVNEYYNNNASYKNKNKNGKGVNLAFTPETLR